MFGSRVSYIAWYWWILERTDSPTAIALMGIATALPTLLLGPIAGAFVDRLDRRRVLFYANLFNAVLFGLAAWLMMAGHLRVWHAYTFAAASSTAMALHRPALKCSIPNLVRKDQLTRANSMYQISRGVSGLVGLLVGGILVGTIGVTSTLWLDAGTFLLAGLSLLFVTIASPRCQTDGGWRPVLQETADGFRYLMGERDLCFLLLLFALVNFLFAPIGVIFPLLSKNVFQAGPEGLGWLNGAVSAGLLVGGLITAAFKKVRRHGLGILLALIATGISLSFFGATNVLWIALALLAVLGVFVAIANVFESVIYQKHVPNDLQGRVFAAQHAVGDGLQPISLAAIGGILTEVSPQTVLIASGLIVIAASLAGFAIRGIKEL